ncbi:hypothetical protein [Aerococcus christensenii]|nr:hypothetical protein [Aerococcus christensenii]WEB70267.1 hypothetical protein PUW42_04155 [Aerococcus christensenii]
MGKVKDEAIEPKKDKAEKIAKDLTGMNEKDLEKMYWLMQGIKIVRNS